MYTCESCQSELLSYLYDLLDANEQQALEEHLRTCPTCQAALEKARGHKSLLAAAAKAEFAQVRFTPPAEPTVVETPYVERKLWAQSDWAMLALAASVLLTVGLAVPASWWTIKSSQLQLRAEEQRARLAALQAEHQVLVQARQDAETKAQAEVNRVHEQQNKLLEGSRKRWAELEKSVADKQIGVMVSGPEVLQPGARNDYQIATRNRNNQPVPVKLTALVKNDRNEIVFSEKDVPSSGIYKLSLPPNLPLKPESKLFLEVLAEREGNVQQQVREQLSLAAPVYLTHLATDKPMYRPGEKVYFRSLTLERFTLKPADREFRLLYTVTNPNGEEVFRLEGSPRLVAAAGGSPMSGPDGKPLQGVGAGVFPIDANAKGGEYTLTAREMNNRFPEQKRKFIINQYENPRLNKELDFTRKSYGPNDEVVAACKVTRAEGGSPVANQQVLAFINIDGQDYDAQGKPGRKPLSLATDGAGAVRVRFQLPAQIERGIASVTVQFTDGGSTETLVRPIPIALKKLFVEFFPEGGDLVAGVPNRVYFQARTTLGKPAELKGRLVDKSGKTVVEQIETLNDDMQPGANQGMGLFAFKPEAGQEYELKIELPAGIESRHVLPTSKTEGITLQVTGGVNRAGQPITAQVHSAEKERTLLIGAYCRGRLLDHQTVIAKQGQAVQVELNPGAAAGGVCRVTVFEDLPGAGNRRQLVPRAERLIYRVPEDQLKLEAKPNLKQYVPGERVRVELTAKDERNQPKPAVVGVAVVDKSVVTMADEKTYRTMPTHFLLTSEVRKPEDLEYADFLLGTHPKAATALDLLLGTQGWRRFAEQDPGIFRQKFKDDAERLLLVMGQNPRPSHNQMEEEALSIREDFARDYAMLGEERKQADKALQSAQQGEKVQAAIQQVALQVDESRRQRDAALQQLSEFKAWWENAITSVVEWILGLGLLILLILQFVYARRSRGARLIARLAALGLVGFCLAFWAHWILAPKGAPGREANVSLYDGHDGEAKDLAMAREPKAEPARDLAPLRNEQANNEGMPQRRAGAQAVPGPAGAKFNMPPAILPKEAKGDAGPALLGLKEDAKPAMPANQAAGGVERFLKEADQFKKEAADAAPRAPAPADDRLAKDRLGGGEDKKTAAGKDVRQQGLARGKGMDGMLRAKKALEARKPEAPAQNQAGFGEAARELADRGRAGARMDGVQPGLGAGGNAAGRVNRAMDEPQAPPAAAGLGGFGGGIGGGFQGGFGGGMQGEAFYLKLQEGPAMKGGLGRGFPAGGRAGAQLGVPMLELEKLAEQPLQVPPPPFVVREYAHQHTSKNDPTERTDFADTLFWSPAVVLANGQAEISFDLCDSVTAFSVMVFGHTLDGRLGAITTPIEVRLPFALEPKLPIEVTSSDKLMIPISIANNTTETRGVAIGLSATGLRAAGEFDDRPFAVPADSRMRKLITLQPNIVEGQASLRLEGRTDAFTDRVERGFRVVPDGFPFVGSQSDLLEQVARQDVVLPESWLPGTLKCQVQVYPSTLADIQKGLEALLREPNGCFEQTSTTNYPNVLILDYLRESDQVKPELERRARQLLARGYQQLTSFECYASNQKREGYEWFGGTAPAHEALTAYGLMQFRDMQRVYDVDKQMVDRTAHYLMSRKDGQGGFSRNPRALDTFGRAPDNITNAYIVWALTESGQQDDVEKELAALADQAKTSKDPYYLSLVAISLINRQKQEEGIGLLKKVVAAQQADGHLDAGSTSITGSGGRDLQIETTALAVLGWLKANRPVEFNLPLQKAVGWIGKQRGGYGGFGSTQSTILCLKALIAYAKANKKTAEAGQLALSIGNQPAAKLNFPAGAQDALVLNVPDAEKLFKPGKNPVSVEITGKNVFPYTLTWSYRTPKPVSADQCPVRLDAKLDRQNVKEGESVHLTVTMENAMDKGQGMAVAIIGLPGGLTLPEDMKQLKDHASLRNEGKERGLISAWETRGRELILYWRDLAPKQKIVVPVDLICRVPGEYRGPASRAYLYYNADHKYWVDPLRVTIEPSASEDK